MPSKIKYDLGGSPAARLGGGYSQKANEREDNSICKLRQRPNLPLTKDFFAIHESYFYPFQYKKA